MNPADSQLVSSTALEWAHPIVRQWFLTRLGTLTEPQEQGWPPILAGKTTLIFAPTGSGKTLAAFLACIDRLVRKALAGDLTDRTEILYVSPLKALGNDMHQGVLKGTGVVCDHCMQGTAVVNDRLEPLSPSLGRLRGRPHMQRPRPQSRGHASTCCSGARYDASFRGLMLCST